MERVYEYCKWVKKNKSKTCEYVKLAVKRFEEDLKKSKDEDYPFYFDEEIAQRFLDFTECLKLYKDQWAGKPLKLEPWQAFCLANIYGWVRKDNKRRRFTKAFIFVGRKNGKTVLVSSSLLWDLLTTAGGEAYTAATKKDQAKIAYENAKQFVLQNKGLSDRIQIYNSTTRMICRKNASKIEALSNESNKFDGLNPSVVVVDECSAMKDYSIIKPLQSGMYSRPEPLMLEITSGSDDLYSVGRLEYERSVKVLEGSIEADEYFCILYTLDKKDDWKNPKCYIKANPNLGVSVFEDKLIKARDEAIQQPALEGEFRTKNLGQFVSPINVWIPYQTWNKAVKNGDTIPFPEDRVGESIICGAVDLSERYDWTAYSLYFFFPSLRKYFARHKFYFPEGQIENKMKHDSPMMYKWIEEGLVTATRGDIINYSYMFADIKSDLEKYNILEIAYDPYNSTSLITELQDLVDLTEVQQSIKNMSPMSKDWEASVINNEVVDNNPVMRWMVSNCKALTDINGNIKPIKNSDNHSATIRIDGVITSLMAHGRCKANFEEGYDGRTPEQIARDMEASLANIDY